MSRLLIAAALLALTIATTAGAEPGPHASGHADGPAPSKAGAPDPELRGCGDAVSPPGFRCGFIKVPFERADPSYGTTRIGFAVRERDRAGRRSLGTIFAQEGGPGYSSTGTARDYVRLFGKLLRRRDLVLVDMRGTGLSRPLRCTNLQAGIGPEFISLPQCARRLGERFVSYRTSAAADDMDAVRAALGVRKMILYGDSYGTFFAQSYAYRHGDRVRAMVLDSAYPAIGESPWYGSLIRTGVRSLRLACRRSPRCHGDAGKRLRLLVGFMRRTGRTAEGALRVLGGATYGTPGSYLRIDRAGVQLRRGNPRPWLRLSHGYLPDSGSARAYSRGQELAVSCNDYPMLWDKAAPEAERRLQLAAAIRARPRTLGPFTPREVALSPSFSYLDCITWPQPTAVYEPPISPGDEPTAAPVLVVSGEMDNLTTPQEGRWTARLFPRARQFIARNAGHVDALYHVDGAAARRIRAFIARHS